MTPGFYQDLFANAALAGVRHLPHGPGESLTEGARAAGCLVLRVDLGPARDKAGMLEAIGAGLRFPNWFGCNWDALADSLADMGWLPAPGYVIVLEHCDGIHGRAEADFITMLRIFEEAADTWREAGIPFWCLVDLLADGIAWLPTVVPQNQ